MTVRQPMEPVSAARLRRGYAAAVSYTDSNIGTVLQAVDRLGFRDSTVVLMIGDHGWSLGEQNTWCKMTNWENGVRTPLIVRAPGFSPGRTAHLAEAVDMYRTLADAVGLLDRVEPSVDGVSLLPLLSDPSTQHPPRVAAQSQFPRCYSNLPPYVGVPPFVGRNATAVSPEKLPQLDRTDCQDTERTDFDLMGYSLRTASFRITEYRMWDGVNLQGRWDLPPNATELYDHRESPSGGDVFASETVNVAFEPAMKSILADLRKQLRQRFSSDE